MNVWTRVLPVLLVLLFLGRVAVAAEKPLSNSDVINLVKAGLSEGLIKKKILSTPCGFDMSTEAMIELNQEGVPQEIIELMLTQQTQQHRKVRSRIQMEIQSLATGMPEQRRQAYLFLKNQGANALPQIRDALTSHRPEIRAAAAETAGKLHDDKAAPLLRELLHDKSREVRFAAAESLAKIKDDEALEFAQKTVAAGAEPLDGYIRLLGHRKDLDFVGFISMRLLKEPEALTREQAAWALGEIGSPRGCDALEDAMLLDRNNDVKRAATIALGKIHAPRSYRKIVTAAKKHPGIRAAALEAISHYPPEQSVEFLIVALGQKLSPEEQKTVLDGLRRLTNRDFGMDLERWNEWLTENRPSIPVRDDTKETNTNETTEENDSPETKSDEAADPKLKEIMEEGF